MWCIITSVLFQDGDVQFLDEVTNYLDPPRTILLQTCRISLLRSLPKIVVLVSNDRDFVCHDMEKITCTGTEPLSVSKEPPGP